MILLTQIHNVLMADVTFIKNNVPGPKTYRVPLESLNYKVRDNNQGILACLLYLKALLAAAWRLFCGIRRGFRLWAFCTSHIHISYVRGFSCRIRRGFRLWWRNIGHIGVGYVRRVWDSNRAIVRGVDFHALREKTCGCKYSEDDRARNL